MNEKPIDSLADTPTPRDTGRTHSGLCEKDGERVMKNLRTHPPPVEAQGRQPARVEMSIRRVCVGRGRKQSLQHAPLTAMILAAGVTLWRESMRACC